MDLSWSEEVTALRRGAEEFGPSLNGGLDRVDALAPGDPLLDGALDSVDVLRLVVFVDERYAVTIKGDDLVPENFATVAAVASLVHAKTSGAAA